MAAAKKAVTSKAKMGRPTMSEEARAAISRAAKEMHARRKAAKEAGSKATELRQIADVLDTAMKLSPEARQQLKSLL